jgi:serine/threonine protein kinase
MAYSDLKPPNIIINSIFRRGIGVNFAIKLIDLGSITILKDNLKYNLN